MVEEPAHWGPTELANLPPEEWERFRPVGQFWNWWGSLSMPELRTLLGLDILNDE